METSIRRAFRFVNDYLGRLAIDGHESAGEALDYLACIQAAYEDEVDTVKEYATRLDTINNASNR